jgi:uncharacterized cupin superfamily protein
MKIEVKTPTKDELEKLNIENWPIWECEPSEFDWEYDEDEQCYFLEGKIKVITNDGEVEIKKGDFVKFPKGLKCRWVVYEKVKKHYKLG